MLKKRWSYFIRKVYEADPLTCPKCQDEMRITSFVDHPEVTRQILSACAASVPADRQHLGLRQEFHAPAGGDPVVKEIASAPSFSQLT